MKQLNLLAIFVLLAFAGICEAQAKKFTIVDFNLNLEGPQRTAEFQVKPEFNTAGEKQPVSDAVKAFLTDPNFYVFTEEPSTDATPVQPRLNELPMTVSHIDLGRLNVNVFTTNVSGVLFGRGGLKFNLGLQKRVPDSPQGHLYKASDVIDSAITDSRWIIAKESTMRAKIETDFATSYDKNVFSAKFAFSSPATLSGTKKSLHRESFSFSGNVPFGKPSDARAAGSPSDASGHIADFLNLTYEKRTYNGDAFTAVSFIGRSTGSARGVELVANYVPYVHIDLNSGMFLGTSLETGYRSGDAEWTSLTTKGPSSGNVVARLGGVVEFMPKLGPINGDRAEGLRFFARARGWMDYYKNAAGSNSTRYRHFLDAEFFYNFSSNYRVFVRGEQGYFLPDLSKRVGRLYIGMGTAF